MSTVQLRHHSSILLHLLMGLAAALLALAAAYLWLTDEDVTPISLPEPSAAAPPSQPSAVPQAAAPTIAVPPASSTALAPPQAAAPVPPQAVAAASVGAPASALTASPSPTADSPTGQAPAQALDPQVAADAAAAGMTTRVRPAPPVHSVP